MAIRRVSRFFIKVNGIAGERGGEGQEEIRDRRFERVLDSLPARRRDFFFFPPPSFRLGSQLEDGSFINVNVDGGGDKQFE